MGINTNEEIKFSDLTLEEQHEYMKLSFVELVWAVGIPEKLAKEIVAMKPGKVKREKVNDEELFNSKRKGMAEITTC